MKFEPMDSTGSPRVFLLVHWDFSICKGCFCGRKEGWGGIPPALQILRLRSGQVLGEISSNFIRTHAVMYYCYFVADRRGFEPGGEIVSLQRFSKRSLSP